MLPLGLEAPGGTEKEDQLATEAGTGEMGMECVLLNTDPFQGATGGTKEHLPSDTFS